MGEFSLTHILLLAILGLIFFGPSRLPQLGQGLGKAIRGFKQGLNEIDVDPKDIQDHKQVNHTSQQTTQSQKQTETQNS
ncbi:twin-arginine translocase TatA/TatE family subunit [Bdellovibrio bacteriovorus]|uniref:Sec-independent protein translocase protein TatA n=1 Tax=Bdellovibrio bacteriovorus TaxID=959 RepID=A0A150WDY1_BDEBC|nr:twin-arginine translocase TatA/TatE family subunit [Bdellovibrio bacteriovorus]KYG61082.1 preprotein translocase subunit TatA [Bdellovibrio bacteriovorus]